MLSLIGVGVIATPDLGVVPGLGVMPGLGVIPGLGVSPSTAVPSDSESVLSYDLFGWSVSKRMGVGICLVGAKLGLSRD